MKIEDSALVRVLGEEIQELERLQAETAEKLELRRRLLVEVTTGKPALSPSSSGARVAISAIKPFLQAHGPARKDEIVAHLLAEWKQGRISIVGADEKARVANIRRSITKCKSSETIIQDGDLYRLP